MVQISVLKPRRNGARILSDHGRWPIMRQYSPNHHMTRVRGIGGIFFKSQNPEALNPWYEEHLGICFAAE